MKKVELDKVKEDQIPTEKGEGEPVKSMYDALKQLYPKPPPGPLTPEELNEAFRKAFKFKPKKK